MAADDKQAFPEFTKGLWRENPVFIAVLGLCPAMAVTNSLKNGLVMGVATLFVLVGSSTLVSLLRKVIPKAVRISSYIIIIATFVTTVDFLLAALMPEAHKQLGAFISLIVVNCIILGRAEAFAAKHKPFLAIADGLGMASGFTLALAMIGGIREILGSGTLLGFPVMGDKFEPWAIMVLPPGGFLTLGVLLTTFAWFKKRRAEREAKPPAPAEIEGEVV
ncbi:MAG: electron transport complex subunit E [Polyangiaceae bacterium]